MAATITIIITSSLDTVKTLNDKIHNDSNPRIAAVNAANYLNSIAAGVNPASIQIVTRNSDPSVVVDAHPLAKTTTHNLK